MALRLNEKFGNARLRGTLLHLHADTSISGAVISRPERRSSSRRSAPVSKSATWSTRDTWPSKPCGRRSKGATRWRKSARWAKEREFARQSHIAAVYETIRLEQQFVASLQGGRAMRSSSTRRLR